MALSFNRKYMKLVVDYIALSLMVVGVVCFLLGLGLLIDLGRLYTELQKNDVSSQLPDDSYATSCKIFVAGILQIGGGLLLLTGIIKGHKVLVLVYVIASTIGLVIASGYGLYVVIMIYKVARSTTTLMVIFIAIIWIIFSWCCQFYVYCFYKELEEEGYRRTNQATAMESAPLPHIKYEDENETFK